MKAVQIDRYGDNQVIKVRENITKPKVNVGQILIEVHAASINPVDWKIRSGHLQQLIPLTFPATLGMDFSGVIVEVANDVTHLKKGDEVFGWTNVFNGGSGSFAEFLVTDAKTAALKPENITHVDATALAMVGVTAWQAMMDYLKISKDEKVLIHGGSGGVGMMAIQIAKYIGAYVATTVNETNFEFVKNLGADVIINYKTQHFEKELHDYDAVLDTVGGKTYQDSFQILKKNGTVVSLLESPNPELMKQHHVKAELEFTAINSGHLLKLAELLRQQKLKIFVEKIFPIEQAADAFEYQEKQHPRGKVVLQIK